VNVYAAMLGPAAAMLAHGACLCGQRQMAELTTSGFLERQNLLILRNYRGGAVLVGLALVGISSGGCNSTQPSPSAAPPRQLGPSETRIELPPRQDLRREPLKTNVTETSEKAAPVKGRKPRKTDTTATPPSKAEPCTVPVAAEAPYYIA
jgi:hypothetical protein